MADWQAGDVEANGARLHYTRTGGNLPPLVLAHGVTDDGLCWTPVAEALQDEYDVIMVDARGHGQSDGPEGDYGLATLAADLHGVIVELGLHKPLILGHSMGAATTLVLAGMYPELPRAILLEDPPGWWAMPAEPTANERERIKGMQSWFMDLKRKSREQMIAGQRAATPHWSEAEVGPWADSKLRASENVGNFFNLQTPRSVDWPTLLRRITCPALVIMSDQSQGSILAQNEVELIWELVPQLQVEHVAAAGHNIRRDQFKRYMDIVRAFLAGLAAQPGSAS